MDFTRSAVTETVTAVAGIGLSGSLASAVLSPYFFGFIFPISHFLVSAPIGNEQLPLHSTQDMFVRSGDFPVRPSRCEHRPRCRAVLRRMPPPVAPLRGRTGPRTLVFDTPCHDSGLAGHPRLRWICGEKNSLQQSVGKSLLRFPAYNPMGVLPSSCYFVVRSLAMWLVSSIRGAAASEAKS